jgi:hypothetical protein
MEEAIQHDGSLASSSAANRNGFVLQDLYYYIYESPACVGAPLG